MRWVVLGGSRLVGAAVVLAVGAAGPSGEVLAAPRLDAASFTAVELPADSRGSVVLDRLSSVLKGAAVVVLAARRSSRPALGGVPLPVHGEARVAGTSPTSTP